jgi:hypothetical protein
MRFPLGSDQRLLERDLIIQKFRRYSPGITHCRKPGEILPLRVTGIDCPSWDLNWNPQHDLWYWNCERSYLVCEYYARVIWSANSRGQITHIQAGYTRAAGS